MSNETQWTPGPWTLKMRHRDSAIIETRDRTIASLMQYGDTDRAADANARLIAAAPEMAAALEALFEHCAMTHKYWGDGCNRDDADRAISAARALLAKIKKGA